MSEPHEERKEMTDLERTQAQLEATYELCKHWQQKADQLARENRILRDELTQARRLNDYYLHNTISVGDPVDMGDGQICLISDIVATPRGRVALVRSRRQPAAQDSA